MDDEGETISKIDIDTEAYTGEALSAPKNPLLDRVQKRTCRMGLS